MTSALSLNRENPRSCERHQANGTALAAPPSMTPSGATSPKPPIANRDHESVDRSAHPDRSTRQGRRNPGARHPPRSGRQGHQRFARAEGARRRDAGVRSHRWRRRLHRQEASPRARHRIRIGGGARGDADQLHLHGPLGSDADAHQLARPVGDARRGGSAGRAHPRPRAHAALVGPWRQLTAWNSRRFLRPSDSRSRPGGRTLLPRRRR